MPTIVGTGGERVKVYIAYEGLSLKQYGKIKFTCQRSKVTPDNIKISITEKGFLKIFFISHTVGLCIIFGSFGHYCC